MYASMADCFTKSIKNEGILVLWKGFTPGKHTRNLPLLMILCACFEGGACELCVFHFETSFLLVITAICIIIGDQLSRFSIGNAEIMQKLPLKVYFQYKKRRLFCNTAFIKLAPYTIISLTLVDNLTKAITGKDAL
jgi:hypothetical protein